MRKLTFLKGQIHFAKALKDIVHKGNHLVSDFLTWLLAWTVRLKGTRCFSLLPTASPMDLMLGSKPSEVQR